MRRASSRSTRRQAKRLLTETLESRYLLAVDIPLAAGPVGVEVDLKWQGDLFAYDAVDLNQTLALARTQPYVANELLLAVPDRNALDQALSALQLDGRADTQVHGSVFSRTDGASLVHVSVDRDLPLTQALNIVDGVKEVYWSTPNFVYEGSDPREFTPNDPSFSNQWHHPVIQSSSAWDVTLGDASIVVGITDDGIDLDHPDLDDAIWVNSGEIPGNGVDDDNNGYVDDVNGYNFLDNNAIVNAPSGRNHGTHVGGIVGAEIDNGIGVAGTAGGTTILPLRWYGGGSWTSSIIAETFAYAADNGVDIVNTSYNMDGWANNAVVMSAFQYMYDAGVLHFNSAGNGGALNPPRQVFEQTLLVANTTSSDTKSGSSNYGDGIDVAAPGSSILSTVIGGYASLSGTSMAAPNAAAVAALIWSANPTWTREQVVAQLLATADNIDAQNPNFVGLLGAGRINSGRALNESLAAPQIASLTGLPLNGAAATANSVSGFTLRFDQFMDPASVLSAASYDLRQPGSDGIFDTADDVLHSLTPETSYMVGTNEFDVSIDSALGNGSYRLRLLAGGLQNPFGTPLDGDGNGTGGDPFETFFSVDFEPTVRTGLEGSGASISAANQGTLVASGLAQDHLFLGEPGELITAVIRPAANVTATAEFVGLGPATSATVPGQAVALPTTVIPVSGEVTLRVSADGASDYEFDILRNVDAQAWVDLDQSISLPTIFTGVEARRFSAIGSASGEVANPDIDEFEISLAAGEQVDVVLKGLDTSFAGQSLTIEDSMGTQWATSSGGLTSNYDLGILGFVAPATDDYVVRVESTIAGDYEMLVSEGLVFETQFQPATMLDPRSLDNGEGALGYLGDNEFSYTRVNHAGAFIDISGTGAALGLGDDQATTITTTVGNALLPAGSVSIGNNGGVVAGNESLPRTNLTLPYFGFDNAILPYWDDLEAITGDVYWEERQVNGIDTLIVQWDELTHFTGGTMTFQLQLFESGPVQARFVYEDVMVPSPSGTGGRSATIGVQTDSDTLQFSHNQVTLSDGDVIDILAKDVDRYAITGTAGQTLLVSTRTPWDESLGNLENQADPGLQIRDVTGALLAADSDSVDGRNASIEFSLPSSGTYFVEVLSEGASGEYELSSVFSPTGDFDGDGDFDVADLDQLVAVIAAGTNAITFDLTGDNSVDLADRDAWLTLAGAANLPSGNAYLVGDANLDGSVDGADFVLWNTGKFTATAAWSLGDFNADGNTDGADFVLWNINKFTSADERDDAAILWRPDASSDDDERN